MKKIKRAFKLHKIFIVQELKRMMEYKGDFLLGVFGFIAAQAVNIAYLLIIFSIIPNLAGWSFDQIVFIYGFSLIPKAIDHLFFDNLWAVGHYIVAKGEFDKYLIRPINPLFQVLIERLQPDALGELIFGIILIIISIGKLAIVWSFAKVALFILVIPFAVMIYTGIKIGTSALALWIKRSGNITFMFYMVNDFAKYPTTIYNNFIKAIITYIIPFAFTAFYPAKYILTGDNPLFNIGGTIIIGIAILSVSLIIWNKGIKSYESAGS